MPYRDPADKAQHMRDYRELKQHKIKRQASERLYKRVSRIAVKTGISTDNILSYRSLIFPKELLLKLAVEIPKPPHTQSSGAHTGSGCSPISLSGRLTARYSNILARRSSVRTLGRLIKEKVFRCCISSIVSILPDRRKKTFSGSMSSWLRLRLES